MLIVGIGHRDGVGKSTAAKILADLLSTHAEIISFASPIKQVAEQLFSWAGLRNEAFYEHISTRHLKDVRLPLIQKSPRDVWIEIGESGRRVASDAWIRQAFLMAERDVVIIPDVRKRNEAEEILNRGGRLLQVENPRVAESEGNRVSELRGFCEWDWRVENDGTFSDLEKELQPIAREILRSVSTQ